jgi:hypothetical protein
MLVHRKLVVALAPGPPKHPTVIEYPGGGDGFMVATSNSTSGLAACPIICLAIKLAMITLRAFDPEIKIYSVTAPRLHDAPTAPSSSNHKSLNPLRIKISRPDWQKLESR